MIRILFDYFSVNGARIRKSFFIMYALLLVGQIVLMLQSHSQNGPRWLLTQSIMLTFLSAFVIGAFVVLVGIIDAILKGLRLARAANMRLTEYVKSDDYRQIGRNKLKRSDPERKLF